uniref:NADH-ubiquinone oxidoreductase chain 5 n=1 Tax=Tropidocephala brunnipennis TaxID=2008871 RepID=A0A7S4YYV0_9HEMI|nr:NADH dehydrogenase subunit 5 [Tropidocephala brunnipennis]QBZ38050.1 NADH dehydrogenase subunit 5 [Tropidocephala brunnipennis]
MLFVYNIFFFFFFLFFFFFIFGMYFYMFDFFLIMDYNFFSLNSSMFSLIFIFDWLSMIFLSIVFLISGSVLLYSLDYMNGDKSIIRFYFLVFMFILSMFFLISMPDFICLMIGWDGLGLVSYCLVIYYQSSLSLSSGYLTLFINRLGDLFLIFCIGWCFNYGCWHYFYIYSIYNIDSYLIFFLMMACLTKSAQFPFSSWLPAAMAAPTPVSSLVHSSTLVTAGVYLMIRFNMFLIGYLNFFLLNLSLLTILMSGFAALYENDLSKIVAFSTMGQLGFMIFIILMGCEYLGFIHLLIHAIFKSLLFLCSGFFIMNSMGVQDIRFMGNLGVQNPFVSSCFLISLFSLCGLPFYSGYFSSDFIIELFILSEINFFYFIIFFFSIYLTLIYCIRVFMFLFIMNLNMNFISYSSKFYMSFSCFVLTIFSVFSGSLFFWLFDSMYIFIFDYYFKYLILFFFIYFCFFYNIFFYINLNFSHFIFFFFGYMWFLPYFSSIFLVSKFFNLSHLLFNLFELSWTEYLLSLQLIKFMKFKNYYFNLLTMNTFKIYMISFFIFIMLILIF